MTRPSCDKCFLPIPGPVWLSVKCSAQAEILDQCTHSDWGASGCGHNQDVGVVCNPGELSYSGSLYFHTTGTGECYIAACLEGNVYELNFKLCLFPIQKVYHST